MKYLKVFNTDTEYQNFSEGDLFVSPNISYIRTNKGLKFTPIIPAAAGDVAYWDGSKVKTTPLSSWNTSLGTPVGVVVVPTGFAPDGKTRIIGLKPVDTDGNQTNSAQLMKWSYISTDTSLTNYTKVPITDNTSSASTGSSTYGDLPSDAIPTSINSITSFIDPNTNYDITAKNSCIPSPYIGDKPNPEYYKELDGNNALSDFNGLSNTQTLVGLGTGYTAANAAYKYNDGASNLQWYLPGIGELGFLAPRFNVINNTLLTLNGIDIFDINTSTIYIIKSSTEYSNKQVFDLSFKYFDISYRSKGADAYVYPFAII